MTGPEHYREAERLLEAGEYDSDEMDLAAYDVGRAQVHATLATAAAFLAVAVIRPGDRDAWDHAMGTTGDNAEVTR